MFQLEQRTRCTRNLASTPGCHPPLTTVRHDDSLRMTHDSVLTRYAMWQDRWREPILSALLGLLACEVFLNIPLAHARSLSSSVLAVMWLFLIVTTALIATRKRAATLAMLVSAIVALVANVLRIDEPSTLTIGIGAGSCAVFMLLLSWVVWGAVDGPGPVTYHRVRGAIVIYLSIGLAFAALYELLITLVPNAITSVPPRGDYLVVGKSVMYYSLSTLTSIGYGDLLPVHPIARSLSTFESVIGQLFPAILVARIIAQENKQRRPD